MPDNYTQDIRYEPRLVDVLGRLKTSRHQNIYEADFEYGAQPLRWESLTVGSGTIVHLPGTGGVRMRLTTASGDMTIRQSRPYHRYQPGKTMMMSTAVNFGIAQSGQVQRIGMFDDSNGVFFEQASPTNANPFGIAAVVRSDTSGVVTDTRFNMIAANRQSEWNGDAQTRQSLDWTRIQMLFVEFAWYGAGAARWGVMIDGQPFILHQVGFGNRSGQTEAWARTGNLPVRYEQRNLTAVSAQNDMIHWGVSVLVEGGIDDQRGFTYSYGTPWNATSANAGRRQVVIGSGTAGNRIPLVSVRGRTMGTQEYTQASSAITSGTTTTLVATGTPWTVNQWRGRFVNYGTPAAGMLANIARIVSNTTNTLTLADVVTGGVVTAPVAGQSYTIGQINRGQLLPRRLQVTSDQAVFVELVVSSPTSAVNLTGANFVSNSLTPGSFALIDSSASAFTTSGEIVYSIFVPANQPVDQQIDTLFPLVNTIRGNATDILTALVTNTSTTTAANVSVQVIAQEAMS